MSMLFNLKDHFQENQLYLNRTVTASIAVLTLLLVLIGRLFFLQVYKHDMYATLAHNNSIQMLSVPPTRGLIFDCNGVLLADNIPVFSLEINSGLVKNVDATIAALQKIININEQDIKLFKRQLKFKNKFDRLTIRNKLTEEEVAKFSLEKYKFPGIEVAARLSRHYTYPEEMAHVLGYIGPISEQELPLLDNSQYRGTHIIGKNGLEKSFEDVLHGNIGYEKVEADARGRIIRSLERTNPKPGENIYLTIDSRLQNLAYQILANDKGAIVALDVKTGGVLAMVSKPSFNNNLFVQGLDQEAYNQLHNAPGQPLFNRAISGQYPPGSTIKPLMALQALENGVIQANTHIFDPGYYKLHGEGRLFRNWRPEGHGLIDVENALAESCTTFFYYVAEKLGIDKIHDIYQRFGLGSLTNINIIGESAGIAPSAAWKKQSKQENWFPGETLITGIGQGYTLVTPIQMAQVAATLANRGRRVQPTLLKSTQAQDNAPVAKEIIYKPSIQLNNDKHWNLVFRGMEKAISSPRGTARQIFNHNLPYKIAGKTGTAQVFSLKQDEKYDPGKVKDSLRDHAWFIAFAPMDDPQIAISVIVEHNKGSTLIARKLLDVYFNQIKNK